MDRQRPDPDELLRRVQKLEPRANRGKLRIFLGMSAGVGKTCAMLRTAQRLKAEGVDVVAAFVETHGRKETAGLTQGLSILPRRLIPYRGTTIEELDLDALLARKPEAALIDELAHTNAPGGRHPKRFQDVIEALEAGIDIYTTLNVQHLESRVEKAMAATGAVIHETVPDSILDLAEDVQLVDLSPEELRGRLAEGKVYHGDKAGLAAENFFRLENLVALRELAFRVSAERASREARDTLATSPEGGSLLVAIDATDSAASLIRQGRRLAASLARPWTCVHVEGEGESDIQKKTLASHLNLARELGAEVRLLPREDIAKALCDFAREIKADMILAGTPAKRLRLGPDLSRRLLKASAGLTVLFSETEEEKARAHFSELSAGPPFFRELVVAFVAMGAATLVGFLISSRTGYGVVSFIYLLVVSLLATRLGRLPTLIAATLGAVLWNFLFIPPIYTFRIDRLEDGLMFGTYFAVAVIVSHLTWRLKRRERFERKREERTRALYRLTQGLVDSVELEDSLTRACAETEKLFGLLCALWLTAQNSAGTDSIQPGILKASGLGTWQTGAKETSVAEWAFLHARSAGASTDTLPESEGLFIPLRSGARMVGVLGIRVEKRNFSLDERELLETISDHFASLVERFRLIEESNRAKVAEASEKLYRTLFDSISHELKTPLSIIQGATGLLHITVEKSPSAMAFLTDIEKANQRLRRVIENMLDMTRLESGRFQSTPTGCDIRDVISAAERECADLLTAHRFEVSIPDGVAEVRAEPVFLEHALSNLIANAAIHTHAGGRILVSVSSEKRKITISVRDEGPGIPVSLQPKIFEKFFRGPDTKPGGTGLGLSTVKGLVESFGGSVRVVNNPDRGATFSIVLPEASENEK